jgi:hypothetical protein
MGTEFEALGEQSVLKNIKQGDEAKRQAPEALRRFHRSP